MKPRTPRPEGCLSDFALDRRLARELDAAAKASADAHIAGCDRCSARAADVAREREAFATDAPALRSTLGSPPRRGRWHGPVRVAAGALALAASIALYARYRVPHDGDETRAKGETAKLGFYVNHGGSVRAGAAGERVAPGDGLRFVVTAREATYLAVLSVDGMHRASIYYPSTPEAALTGAGTNVPLPESTTLDATLGDETLYGVFCPRPFATEPLRGLLSSSPERVPALAGCSVDVLHVRKEAISAP